MTFSNGASEPGFTFTGWSAASGTIWVANLASTATVTKDVGTWNFHTFYIGPFVGANIMQVVSDLGDTYTYNTSTPGTHVLDWMGITSVTFSRISGGGASADHDNFEYTVAVPCTNPTIPVIIYSPATVCNGDSVILNIAGYLNDASAWKIYSGSCGGTLIGSTADSLLTVYPSFPCLTYYVRGEGGCVIPGACGSATVNVAPIPFIDLGNDTTISTGDSLILNAPYGAFTYLWSDGFTGQNLTVNAAGIYWVQVTSIYGCINSDTIIIGVGYTLTGQFTYANAAMTGMNNTTLILKELPNNKVDSIVVGVNGAYQFNNLWNANYSLEPVITKPWGGVNSTDALAIMKHFVGLNYLNGIYLRAADVDMSGYVNSSDALMTQKRFLGMISVFPAGDWLWDDDNIIINGLNVNYDFHALCFGDVNSSYIPPQAYSLGHNFPDPYESLTEIEYDLKNAGNVILKVFNVLGEEISEIAEGYHEPGHYKVKFDSSDLPEGIYFYKINVTLKSDDFPVPQGPDKK